MAIQLNLQQSLTKLLSALDSRHLNNPKLRAAFLIVATALFAGGIAIALMDQPDVFEKIDWRPALMVVLIGGPITMLLNALEFILSGRLVGRTISFTRSLEVTVVASAANMLPLPGGAIVRVASLKEEGVRFGSGISVTLLIAWIWIGDAFFYAGAWMATIRMGLISIFFLLGGAATLVSGIAVALWISKGYIDPILVIIVRIALVLTDAFRIYLCFEALGVNATFAQASVFAVASVVGSAVSIVPAGLGVREAVSAALAPVVGLTASVGFLAAALNRVLALLTIAPIAFVLSFSRYST